MGYQDSREDLTSPHTPIIVKVFSGASLGLLAWLANGREDVAAIPLVLGGAAVGLVLGIFHATRNAVRDRGSASPEVVWATDATRFVAVALERDLGAKQMMAVADEVVTSSRPQRGQTELPTDYPPRALTAEDDKVAVVAVELNEEEKQIQQVAQAIRSAAYSRKITPEAGALFPFGDEFYHGVYWYQIAEFWYRMNEACQRESSTC